MIHYVYIGHFARQDDFIAFRKQADGSFRPVVSRPLSMEAIQHVLHQRGLTAASVPEEWGLWFEDGFIVCDRFTHSRDAIEVVRRLTTETGCDVADYSSQSLMPPDELSFAWEPQVQSGNGNLQGKRAEPHAGTAGVQVFELTMDNPEDQDVLNQQLQKPSETDRHPNAKIGRPVQGESTAESVGKKKGTS